MDRLDNPGAYVRTSVVNGCRSWQRRQATERRWLERNPRPEVQLPAEEDGVIRALAHLSHRQRAALVLRFYEDLPMERIAEVLGCRTGTAKSLVSRGLARLRAEVER